MGAFGGLQFPSIDAAIAQFEGYNTAGTLASTNNNPGNLIYNSYTQSLGAVGSNNGFAVFPNAQTGFSAEDALVSSYANRGATVSQLINAWAPSTAPGNNATSTNNYVNYVANSAGLSPNSPVSAAASLPGATNASMIGSLPGLNPLPQTITPQMTNPFAAPGSLLSQIPWSRIAAFGLGIIVIAGGIYLFKPAQNVINSAVKDGGLALAA